MMTVTAILSSCNKEMAVTEEVKQTQAPVEETEISFQLYNPNDLKTKGIQSFDENSIKTLLICLFRPDGSLDVIREFSDVKVDTKIFTRCEVGANRNIYAIANWIPQTPITKESDIQTALTHLSDNDQSKTVMAGVLKNEAIVYNGTYTIPIKHIAIKISLTGIKNSLEPFNLKGKSIVVKSLSIINVPIVAPLFLEDWTAKNGNKPFSPSEWWNKGNWGSTADINRYTHDIINVTLKAGETYSKVHTFYTYANPIIDKTERLDLMTWTPRQTRIVAEVSIGADTYYYSKKLVDPEANTHYMFGNFVITRKGSNNPDLTIDNSFISSKVKIVDWNVINGGDINM